MNRSQPEEYQAQEALERGVDSWIAQEYQETENRRRGQRESKAVQKHAEYTRQNQPKQRKNEREREKKYRLTPRRRQRSKIKNVAQMQLFMSNFLVQKT